jgi:uncharacterized FlgJ-related protein
MNQRQLTDFSTRYAAAWSSRNPGNLAAFHAKDGSHNMVIVPTALATSIAAIFS